MPDIHRKVFNPSLPDHEAEEENCPWGDDFFRNPALVAENGAYDKICHEDRKGVAEGNPPTYGDKRDEVSRTEPRQSVKGCLGDLPDEVQKKAKEE